MCYIVFISHSLHWCYIKIALQEYVINRVKHRSNSNICVISATEEKAQITKQIITGLSYISSGTEQFGNLRPNGTCYDIVFDESSGIHTFFDKQLRSDLSTQSFFAFCDFEYSEFLNSFLTFFLKKNNKQM